MPPQSRKLNFLELIWNHKDFLWDKHYFGLIAGLRLLDCILFTHYRKSEQVIEILKIDHNTDKLLRDFTQDYGQRAKIKYFIIELDEVQAFEDIAFVNTCGFRRYLRYHHYKLNADNFVANREVHVICREAEYEDIDQIMDLDCMSQALEYRDYLHSSKKFIKSQLSNYYVFVDSRNFSKVLAFVFKNIQSPNINCEFVSALAHSSLLTFCVEAFAERYIRFEKNPEMYFSLSSIHKESNEELEKLYHLDSVSQLLIFEANPRESSQQLNPGLALRSSLQIS